MIKKHEWLLFLTTWYLPNKTTLEYNKRVNHKSGKKGFIYQRYEYNGIVL
ncbi:hypothetical protein ATF84_1243 [[Clostridium] innocuum]|nr:hypothetical protein ATF84_1243 [[Clostridium] innocuum]SSA49126.1 hypothetical protein SAMN04487929_1243 [[Clostridium] innocuum]